MGTLTDLQIWAATTVRDLDADGWREAEECAVPHFNSNRTEAQRWTTSQARALLEQRRHVVDIVSRRSLKHRLGDVVTGDGAAMPAESWTFLYSNGLVDSDGEPTPFGYQVDSLLHGGAR